MDIVNWIQRRLSRSYEITSDNYYLNFLKKDDAEQLKKFIEEFGEKTKIPSSILAVGSSTFPKVYYEDRKKLNQKNPGLDASESYRDIDLLIIPQNITKLTDLESAVKETLKRMKFDYKEHETTTAGVAYVNASSIDDKGNVEKIISPFLHLDYGLHSISTNLQNGTKLDLILGRDDLLKITAKKKIAKERWDKCAFSLLYSGTE